MLDRLGVRCFASIAIRGFPPTNVLSRRMWGFTSAIPAGRTPMLPVFYLHLEPDNCFAAAGIWHPDNRTLTRGRQSSVIRIDGRHSSGNWSLREINCRDRLRDS